MLKSLAILSIAIVAASALTKEEVETSLSDACSSTVTAVDSSPTMIAMAMEYFASSIRNTLPNSASCVVEIAARETLELNDALEELKQEIPVKFASLKSELEAVSDDDGDSLEALQKDIQAASDNIQESLMSILKPISDKYISEVRSSCNCEEDGWCSVFENA